MAHRSIVRPAQVGAARLLFFVLLLISVLFAANQADARNCKALYSKAPSRYDAVSLDSRAGSLIQTLLRDPILGPRVIENMKDRAVIASNEAESGDPTQRTRKILVAIAKEPQLRELLIRAIEADLRRKSRDLGAALGTRGDKVVDFFFIGGGVHDTIANNVLTLEGQGYTSLTVERNNSVASTFAKAGYSFLINSSVKPDFANQFPKPGAKQNLNQLARGPVQVPDIFSNRFTPARSISDTATLNRFSANGNLLFGHEVLKVKERSRSKGGDQWPARYRVKIRSLETGETYYVYTNVVINTTGLGRPVIRINDKGTQEVIANERKRADRAGELPRIISFREAIDEMGSSDTPYRPYANQTIAVVGSGDSAKVVLEFLQRLAPNEAYRADTAQVGYYEKIEWFGVNQKNCDQYLLNNRVRYAKVALGIKNKTIDLIPERVVAIRETKNGRFDIVYEKGGKRRTKRVDRVIAATGFESETYKVFKPIAKEDATGEKFGPRNPLELALDVVRGEIDGKRRKVAKQLPGEEIYWIGASAGRLAALSELKGVTENFASIFATGPRSATFMSELLKRTERGKFGPLRYEGPRRTLDVTGGVESKICEVRLPEVESAPLDPLVDRFLEATFSRIYRTFDLPSRRNFTLRLEVEDGTLRVYSNPQLARGSLNEIKRQIVEDVDLLELVSSLTQRSRGIEYTMKSDNGGGIALDSQTISFF